MSSTDMVPRRQTTTLRCGWSEMMKYRGGRRPCTTLVFRSLRACLRFNRASFRSFFVPSFFVPALLVAFFPAAPVVPFGSGAPRR